VLNKVFRVSTTATAFEELARMARSGEAGLADATLKVQCELFVQDAAPSAAEKTLFSTLALMLLPVASEGMAHHLAARLAPCAHTPAEVLAALEARGGGVAELVIAGATALPQSVEADAAGHPDPRIAASLASRPDLSDELQSRLLERGEATTFRALAANHAVRLSRHIAANLIAAATADAELAQHLLRRTDLDPIALLPLYLFADQPQKARMRDVLDQRLTDRGMRGGARETVAAQPDLLLELSLLGLAALIDGLRPLLGQSERFVAAAMADSSREVTALALMAAGSTPQDAIRMLLRAGDPVALDSARLGQVVDLVRSISRQAATMLLSALLPKEGQAADSAERPVYVPAMVAGGTPARPSPAVSGRRPPAVRNIEKLRGAS
jgi:uncharacterized protein (DUF2336 family)